MTAARASVLVFKTFVRSLAGQKRKAGQYLLDHPKEVGVLSLRQIAARARVSPATFIQLAKDSGYTSYNELKALFQLEYIGVTDYFSGGAESLSTTGSADVEGSSGGMLGQIGRDDIQGIVGITNEATSVQIKQAAEQIAGAKIVNVIGMRACFGVAHYLAYSLQLLRNGVSQLAPGDGTMVDEVHDLGEGDVLIAFGFYPYVRQTVDTVISASVSGAQIIAITDSLESPLAVSGATVLQVSTVSPWIFSSITPAIVVSQSLAAEVLIQGGEQTLGRIKVREQLLSQMKVFI